MSNLPLQAGGSRSTEELNGEWLPPEQQSAIA